MKLLDRIRLLFDRRGWALVKMARETARQFNGRIKTILEPDEFQFVVDRVHTMLLENVLDPTGDPETDRVLDKVRNDQEAARLYIGLLAILKLSGEKRRDK